MVGLSGLEPPTSPLSGVRSNHLSYRPKRISVFFVKHLSNNLCEHLQSLNFGKEVIQPQVPLRLPCYDLSPVSSSTMGPLITRGTSDITTSHALTGGEYKTQEHIHRNISDLRLLAIPTSWSRVADSNPD